MDLLTTHPIPTGWEFTIEPYLGWQFTYIDNQVRQFVNGSVLAQTRTWRGFQEPLLTLSPDNHKCMKQRLHREVVEWGWDRSNLRHTIT